MPYSLRTTQINVKPICAPRFAEIASCSHDSDMRHIGDVIRELRKKKGMNLEDLAHEAGTDAGNISRLETGKQSYTDERLRAIAKALGVRVSQLWQIAEGIEPTEDLSKEALETAKAIERLPSRERAMIQAALHASEKQEKPELNQQDPPRASGCG